jgi:hypothetical protein
MALLSPPYHECNAATAASFLEMREADSNVSKSAVR